MWMNCLFFCHMTLYHRVFGSWCLTTTLLSWNVGTKHPVMQSYTPEEWVPISVISAKIWRCSTMLYPHFSSCCKRYILWIKWYFIASKIPVISTVRYSSVRVDQLGSFLEFHTMCLPETSVENYLSAISCGFNCTKEWSFCELISVTCCFSLMSQESAIQHWTQLGYSSATSVKVSNWPMVCSTCFGLNDLQNLLWILGQLVLEQPVHIYLLQLINFCLEGLASSSYIISGVWNLISFSHPIIDEAFRIVLARHKFFVFRCIRKFVKVTIALLCLSVHLSVRMEKFNSHWMDFHEIWYMSIFRKSVKKIKVSLKSDKNNGYFTWRHAHLWYLT